METRVGGLPAPGLPGRNHGVPVPRRRGGGGDGASGGGILTSILFSATRQFNPGDEMILAGVFRLLSALGWEYNRLLYNRHPMITPNRLPKRLWFRKFWNADNSFFLDEAGAVDYLIVAGSPEWRMGRRMEDLFRYVLRNRVPCAFLAVGAGSGGAFSVDDPRHRLLRQVLDGPCELVTVRDEEAEKALKPWNPHLLPCTALYAGSAPRARTGEGQTGLVFQNAVQRFNSVRPEVHHDLVVQYRRILEAMPRSRVLCHTNADFLAARRAFPGADIFYSAFSEDFEALYDPCDLVIGPRVHGAGLAASLGIPSILVRHSARGMTGWGFRALTVSPGEDLLESMGRVDIPAESRALVAWRAHWMERNMTLLRERTCLGGSGTP